MYYIIFYGIVFYIFIGIYTLFFLTKWTYRINYRLFIKYSNIYIYINHFIDNMALIIAFVGRKYIRIISINNSYYPLCYSFLLDNFFFWHIYIFTLFFLMKWTYRINYRLFIKRFEYIYIYIRIYINHFIRYYMARCLSLLLVESTHPGE